MLKFHSKNEEKIIIYPPWDKVLNQTNLLKETKNYHKIWMGLKKSAHIPINIPYDYALF